MYKQVNKSRKHKRHTVSNYFSQKTNVGKDSSVIDSIPTYKTFDRKGSDKQVLQLTKKECEYCGVIGSPEHHGKKCPAKDYRKQHHFVKVHVPKSNKKTPEQIKELIRIGKEKKERELQHQKMQKPIDTEQKTQVKGQHVQQGRQPHEEEKEGEGKNLSESIPMYTKENTDKIVEYFKLLHPLREKVKELKNEKTPIENASNFRKQTGTYYVKLMTFANSLKKGITNSTNDNLGDGLEKNRDLEYMTKQMQLLEKDIKNLTALPGAIDLKSCDSAGIDLDEQYKRASEALKI